MTTVVCCARPLGYGPASKLHLIAEELRARGARTVFMGAGLAHEFALRAGVNAVEAAADDPVGRALIASSDAVLSLMDPDSLRVAQALAKPSFAVDSLVWMRDRVPEEFIASTRYWAQDFIGVGERLAQTATDATVVGPIVRAMTPAPADTRAGLVVSLGGLDSPYQADDGARRYADFVVDGLLRSELLAAFDGRALVLGGGRCIDGLRRRCAGTRLELASLPHADAVARLRRAALVLTAPGLTTTLECFQLATPTFFLPPQNYSQWWILATLRRRELAPSALHWADRLATPAIVEHMAEEVRVPLVRDLLARMLSDDDAADAFRAALAGVLAIDHAALARRQRAFFATLGPAPAASAPRVGNAAASIAEAILADRSVTATRGALGASRSTSAATSLEIAR